MNNPTQADEAKAQHLAKLVTPSDSTGYARLLRDNEKFIAQELAEYRKEVTADLSEQLNDWQECNEDKKRLCRDIDEILCGKEGMAKQASLCDLVGPIRDLKVEVATLRAQLAEQDALIQKHLSTLTSLEAAVKERDAQLAAERAMADRLVSVLINPFLFGRDEAISAHKATRQPTQDKGGE
jgi:hypothetical protein